ncbi:MAG TPA: carboxypeptidase-like regulatory domain-containing protein, partial [Puia sp.]|nr:carboxypeptidase-like regulatory domain-containing protein [Puia sp.]
MKRFLLFMISFASCCALRAQFPGGGGKVPNMGHIYGKIIDSTGHGVNGATVILLQNKRDTATKKNKFVLLKGLSTKANGDFNFEDLPMFGGLKLKISATGYKPYEQMVVFQMRMPAGGAPKPGADPAQAISAMSSAINGFDKDLGNIKLEIDVTQLASVTVTAVTPTLRMDIDKKVYNVEKDMVNAGGTAL